MASRSTSPRPPSAPPATAEEGAEAIRRFMLTLFDRKDGEAADWALIAGSLFRAAFDAVDKLPENRRVAFARRVHELSYEVMTGGSDDDSGASKTPVVQRNMDAANTAGLKSSRPPR